MTLLENTDCFALEQPVISVERFWKKIIYKKIEKRKFSSKNPEIQFQLDITTWKHRLLCHNHNFWASKKFRPEKMKLTGKENFDRSIKTRQWQSSNRCFLSIKPNLVDFQSQSGFHHPTRSSHQMRVRWKEIEMFFFFVEMWHNE